MISPFRRFSARPDAVGLYDGAHEHDACGVAFVADHARRGRPRHRRAGAHRAAQPRPPRRGRAPSPTPATGPASSPRSPTRSCARSSASTLPPRAPTPSACAFLPDDDQEAAEAQAADRGDRRGGGPAPSSAGATCPTTPDLVGATARGVPAPAAPAVRGRSAAGARGGRRQLERMAFCLRKRAEREAGGLLPVAVRPHPRLQGDAHHRPARAVLPRPVRPALRHRARASCTPGSRRTPSPPGRSRTRSGSSPTTARSTP